MLANTEERGRKKIMNSITERRVIHQVKIDPKISAPKIAASTSNTLGRSVSAETVRRVGGERFLGAPNHLKSSVRARAVQKRSPTPLTPIDLWTALQDSWCQLSPSLLQTLIESMPRRIAALLSARGGST
ncbi:DDE_3 domain-containing protein [Trichonephila clavata]|uniref:DDE_3 domain-containing protein n=1 Tax=Trichonephila clavata TaxID=2740835 RepID=A0A8X6JYD1_TRICU|nr:DDE_3 domain-containing protein [Trichonephila clavata]